MIQRDCDYFYDIINIKYNIFFLLLLSFSSSHFVIVFIESDYSLQAKRLQIIWERILRLSFPRTGSVEASNIFTLLNIFC